MNGHHETNGRNHASQEDQTWNRFILTFGTLADKLAEIKGITNFEGVLGLIRPLWTDVTKFRAAITEIIDAGQPYDPGTGRLKPLLSTITAMLSPSNYAEIFFPEHEKVKESFVKISKERHRDFVELIRRTYIAGGGKPTDAPYYANDRGYYSQEYNLYLYKIVPGTNTVRKRLIVVSYLKLIEGSGGAPLMRNGVLTLTASEFLKSLKVSKADIDALIAPRPLRVVSGAQVSFSGSGEKVPELRA